MKQILQNKFWLRICMLVAILCSAFTGTARATSYISYKDGVQEAIQTISTANVSSGKVGSVTWTGTSCTYSSSRVNIAANGSIKFVANSGYVITKIVIVSGSSSSYYGTWTSSPSVTPSSSSGTTTFEGLSSQEVTVTTSTSFRCTSSSNITIYLATSGDSSTATTTTIDATNITNTDVYTGTAAGSLSATVTETESGSAVEGASVTWSSSNEGVATIDANGAVTLVSAGSVTFTASYDGVTDTYAASSATYDMTVTSSAPYVQPTTIEITPNYTFWGQTAQFSGSTYSSLSGSQDNVTLNWTRGEGSTYANTTAMRFYKDNDLTFTAPYGYEIKSIVLAVSGTSGDLTFSPTGYDSETTTWSGSSATVTMSRPSSGTSYYTISKFTITIGLPSSVVAPTFTVAAGTYTETQNVKVSNYDSDYIYFYTTDGTTPDCDANLDPTGTSVAYNHTNGINISSTTTLKMIAADIDGNKSSVATAEYTFPTIYTTIADFMAANTTGYLNLTGAQVVYIDAAKKNIYVRDASGAVDLYNKDGFTTSLTTGDILSGTIYGKYSPYKNLPEIQNIADISVLTATSNQTVVAKVINGTTEAIAANLCDLVKIENTEISENNSKYYVGDNSDIQLFDNFSVGYTVTTGKTVDVSGIATVYGDTYELFPRFTEDIVYLETSEGVSISDYGYSTYCSDNNLDFTAVDAIKVFYATLEGSTLTFRRIYKVAAGTGVLLASAEGGAVAETHVPFFTGAADDVTGNVFVRGEGSAVSYSETNQNYILFNGDDGIGFYMASNNKVATNRAYIHVTDGNGVKGFAINLEDDATSIETIDHSPLTIDHSIYNIAGQRISKMQKGINIVNGKKVLK